MKRKDISADVCVQHITEINVSHGLDPITVFWLDLAPCQGSVSITCYGSAWTAYFGGTGGRTIREFFIDADTPYLVGKLGITPQLKNTKRDQIYLGRIVRAVKEALA